MNLTKILSIFLGLLFVLFLCIFSGCAAAPSQAEQLKQHFLAQPAQSDEMSLGGIPIDNTTPLEEALTTAYPLADLQLFFGDYIQMLSLSSEDLCIYNHTDFLRIWETPRSLIRATERFPCSVLRYTKAPGIYFDPDAVVYNNFSYLRYSVYRVQEGGYFYVIWGSNEGLDYKYAELDVAKISFYVSRFCDLQEFDSLVPGQSTYADVCTIDPCSYFQPLRSASPDQYFSCSILSDGRFLVMEYQLIREEPDSPLSRQNLVLQSIRLQPSEGFHSHCLYNVLYEDLPPEALEPSPPKSTLEAKTPSLESVFSASPVQTETDTLDGIPVDQETPVKDALSTTYSLAELNDFFGTTSHEEIRDFSPEQLSDWLSQHNLPAANQAFPIQLLRAVSSPVSNWDFYGLRYDNAAYFPPEQLAYCIYPVKEGGYYYVFWQKASAADAQICQADYIMYDAIYLPKLTALSDFDSLTPGESTLADVQKIDPATEVDYQENGNYYYDIVCHSDFTTYGFRLDDNLMQPPEDRELYSLSMLETGELLVIYYQPVKHPTSTSLFQFLDRSNWVVDTVMRYGADSEWKPLLRYVLYEDLP